MKILIHALGANMGGAMRHLTQFLPELGRLALQREYTVLVRQSFPELSLAANMRLERVPDGDCSSWLKRIASDVFELPRRLRREKFATTVSLTNFGPMWSPVPHVLFQRNSLYYCPYYLERIDGRRKIELLLRRKIAVESMRRSAMIVTPSNSMADMIREACPEVKDKKFVTLYHGLEAARASVATASEPSTGPTLLFPSHLAEYKGYRLLFEVVHILKRRYPTLKLILTIGPNDDPELFASYLQQLRRLGIVENVLTVGRVPQESIWDFYSKADLMVYPSYCESFGFAMLEAMGARLPIVAADTRINREICEGSATYFSPFNAAECAESISKLLDSPSKRDCLRTESGRRMSGFDWSWRRYASEFSSILDQLEV